MSVEILTKPDKTRRAHEAFKVRKNCHRNCHRTVQDGASSIRTERDRPENWMRKKPIKPNETGWSRTT